MADGKGETRNSPVERDVARIVACLRCPVCARPLNRTAGRGDAGAGVGGLDCPVGHHFDAARQGYVDLVAGVVRHDGDSAAMVAARADFLAGGYFDFLGTALADATGGVPGEGGPGGTRLVVDAGCGTGYYLARVLDRYPDALGLALDVAKPALRRAARAHPRVLAARADVWRGLPVADGAAAVLLNVFAPRNGADFARALRPDGELIVVVPAPEHLAELVTGLGLLRVDPAKQQRLEQSLGDWFTLVEQRELAQPMRLPHPQVWTLVGMGPSAWHTDPDALARAIGQLPDPAPATARVLLHRYRPTATR